MSYFGLITCANCGQKVSVTPQQVVLENSTYGYFCRRCQKVFELPADFVFKHPRRKDLDVREAIKLSRTKSSFILNIKKIFGFRKP